MLGQVIDNVHFALGYGAGEPGAGQVTVLSPSGGRCWVGVRLCQTKGGIPVPEGAILGAGEEVVGVEGMELHIPNWKGGGEGEGERQSKERPIRTAADQFKDTKPYT